MKIMGKFRNQVEVDVTIISTIHIIIILRILIVT